MKNRASLAVICPVYNEEEVLPLFVERLKATLTTIEDRYSWRALFVLDRSTDASRQILTEMAEADSRVQLLCLSSRFGHQMSLVAGIDHADADAIVMMDADLQHPPELIPDLLRAFEQGNDVVYTIRSVPRDEKLGKRLASRAFYGVINWLSETRIDPGTADFRLISRRVADVFRTQIRERNQFLRGLFSWVGYNRVAIPYEPSERAKGASKYEWSRLFLFAASGVVSFSKKPLHLAIMVGLAFAALGCLLAVWTFIGYFFYSELPSGWTTLTILISIFSGIQLMFLGVLGQYLGAIFAEVKARPLYLVEERVNVD